MTPMEANELIKRLRVGEKVLCPSCKKGHIVASGDYKTTTWFHCDAESCKFHIEMYKSITLPKGN